MTATKLLMVDANIVQELMREKGINDKQLAQLIKVNIKSIKKFLSADNQKGYSIIYLFKIARCLDVDINSILHTDCKM